MARDELQVEWAPGRSQGQLRRAQAALLDEMAPGTEVREIPWSGGRTEVLVLGDGPPLILVHGGMGTSYQWAPILQALAEHHTVLAPDRPGNGMATGFDYAQARPALEDHAAGFLSEVMAGLDLGSATVVGNSMGGRFSIALARRSPERVDHLVLVGAPAGSEGQRVPGPVHAMRIPLIRHLVARSIEGGDAADSRSFHGQCLVAHPDRMPDVFHQAMAADSAANVRRWLPFVTQVLDLGGKVSRELRLTGPSLSLEVPTTLIWGSEDAFAGPDQGREVASWMPDASFRVIDGAGHLPWLDAPAAVTEAILEAAER